MSELIVGIGSEDKVPVELERGNDTVVESLIRGVGVGVADGVGFGAVDDDIPGDCSGVDSESDPELDVGIELTATPELGVVGNSECHNSVGLGVVGVLEAMAVGDAELGAVEETRLLSTPEPGKRAVQE